jgi:hypothetical protein
MAVPPSSPGRHAENMASTCSSALLLAPKVAGLPWTSTTTVFAARPATPFNSCSWPPGRSRLLRWHVKMAC